MSQRSDRPDARPYRTASHDEGQVSLDRVRALTRRDVLTLGALTGAQLTWPGLLRAQAKPTANAGTFGKAKSVIMLYLHGGHPQQETFDPKPGAPDTVRGEFGPIPTALPGVQFCELLPQCAALADKLTVVRSLTHGNTNHVQASLPAQTGHAHPEAARRRGDFPPSSSDFPPIGAVLDGQRQTWTGVPSWVRIGPIMRRSNGTWLHGQLPGFLGERHSPFVVDQNLMPEDVQIEAVSPEVPRMRLDARRDLLATVDRQRRLLDRAASVQTLDDYYARAFDLLGSKRVAGAFDLAAESEPTRERYGKTEFGQRCLLARRLAEAGVPMINVNYCHSPSGSWDTHSGNFSKLKDSLAPDLDAAFSALVRDLDERNMLDETLVIVTAEFGRTPAINKNAGRDHWPFVYSVAMAGAGLRPGTVYGASDRVAAYPASDPHDPADLIATLYHLLGVPAETIIHDLIGRPHPLVIGKKIEGILA